MRVYICAVLLLSSMQREGVEPHMTSDLAIDSACETTHESDLSGVQDAVRVDLRIGVGVQHGVNRYHATIRLYAKVSEKTCALILLSRMRRGCLEHQAISTAIRTSGWTCALRSSSTIRREVVERNILYHAAFSACENHQDGRAHCSLLLVAPSGWHSMCICGRCVKVCDSILG